MTPAPEPVTCARTRLRRRTQLHHSPHSRDELRVPRSRVVPFPTPIIMRDAQRRAVALRTQRARAWHSTPCHSCAIVTWPRCPSGKDRSISQDEVHTLQEGSAQYTIWFMGSWRKHGPYQTGKMVAWHLPSKAIARMHHGMAQVSQLPSDGREMPCSAPPSTRRSRPQLQSPFPFLLLVRLPSLVSMPCWNIQGPSLSLLLAM